MKVDTY